VRAITKQLEPQSLTYYRAQADSNYNGYQQKAELRSSLVTEQMGLCCYCMSRIQNNPLKMKIEHWQSQEFYPQLQLSYGNLLGACLGGQGQPPSGQHCDTKKANSDLKWNPASAGHAIESRLKYLADGTIESPDIEFDDQLNSILGLNLEFLKNSRKVVLDSLLFWWQTTPNARQKIQSQIDRRMGYFADLQPFSPVALWFLRQKLGVVAP
jgi:uncharacterized protein (TIGR02646 family)